MDNANSFPGARVPRNAIRIWQSNTLPSRLDAAALTTSLRTCLPQGSNAIHPLDWPSSTESKG